MPVVTLQLGQCGNQLGCSFFQAMAHELSSCEYPRSAVEEYFRPIVRSGVESGRQDSHSHVARAVMIDMEPKVCAWPVYPDEYRTVRPMDENKSTIFRWSMQLAPQPHHQEDGGGTPPRAFCVWRAGGSTHAGGLDCNTYVARSLDNLNFTFKCQPLHFHIAFTLLPISMFSRAGNNWAHGFHGYGPAVHEDALNLVRREARDSNKLTMCISYLGNFNFNGLKVALLSPCCLPPPIQVEACDLLGGFVLLQSMAGGTGAGLGTYVAQVRHLIFIGGGGFEAPDKRRGGKGKHIQNDTHERDI